MDDLNYEEREGIILVLNCDWGIRSALPKTIKAQMHMNAFKANTIAEGRYSKQGRK